MFKFLHAADIHLDSPCKGLEQYEGAPVAEFRGATRRALEALVRLAVEEQVAFVLIAGDLCDGDWTDFGTGLFLNAQFGKLRDANIPVILIRGNHDAASLMTRSLRPPPNVIELSPGKPETHVVDSCGVAIHGQGYSTRAVRDNLARTYPRALGGHFNVGLLHTCATGRDGHESYAPCSLDDMRGREYDYWALGHIHQAEVLMSSPLIVFPGNIQGRHAKETGPKGCTLVTVDGSGAATVEHRSLDVVRWETCLVDASKAANDDDVLAEVGESFAHRHAARDGRLLAIRVEIAGPSAAHEALIARPELWSARVRDLARDAGSGQIWVEKVRVRTRPLHPRPPEDGPLGDLLALLDELRDDDRGLAELGQELSALKLKLPVELREGDDALDVDSPGRLRELLDEVGPMILHGLEAGDAA